VDHDQDADSDAVRDEGDNCSALSNPAQADQDTDALGDACDDAPANPDRDGDGLLDGQEDADHDAFKDSTETDPNLADTDGDGFSDGLEVTKGSDPLDPGSTPNTQIPTTTKVGGTVLFLVLLIAGGVVLRKRRPGAARWGALVLVAGGACLIAPDSLRSQGGPTERIYYIHTDHLGSPLLLTDANQQVVWRATAEAFGKMTPSVNQIVFNLRFPGQYEDTETGLNYNNHRTFSPPTGRYLEADPMGQGGSSNAYAYVSNNPIILVDILGLTDLNLFSTSDPLYKSAQRFPSDSEVFSVAAHGNPRLVIGINGRPIAARELANLVRANPKYRRGMAVQLLSCNTGVSQGPGIPSYGQLLANELGSLVVAPNNFGWFYDNGHFVVAAPRAGGTWQQPLSRPQADSGPDLENHPGLFEFFYPARRTP